MIALSFNDHAGALFAARLGNWRKRSLSSVAEGRAFAAGRNRPGELREQGGYVVGDRIPPDGRKWQRSIDNAHGRAVSLWP